MKNPIAIHGRAGSPERGVALILVLVLIVLLSILVVSFIAFSRLNGESTVSYANSIQAQEIAQGGLQDILGDLHSEMIAGSVVLTNGSASIAPVYLPITNYTATPARLGYPATYFSATSSTLTLPSSVVRVSRASQDGTPTDLYPTLNTTSYYTNIASVTGGAISNRASAANTSTLSANGRHISAARWNEAYLLACTSSTSSGVAGQQIPTEFATNLPDWVYVTRTGSRACSTNDVPNMIAAPLGNSPPSASSASPVVGRYAYVVYDEGALLDANAAGSPSSAIASAGSWTSPAAPSYSTTSPPPAVTNSLTGATLTFPGKSYAASADLAALPGMTQAQVDTFVNLRNHGGIAASSSSNNPFLSAVFNYSQSGFLKYVTDSTGNSDSPLLSRQDLVNYFIHLDSNFNGSNPGASQALPFLGTFSRCLEAPSWTPTADSNKDPNYKASAVASSGTIIGWNRNPGPILYKTNAETTGSINRDLANLRWPGASGTTLQIVHYFDDQTGDVAGTATYTANAGDPMLQTRFSLARISWLKDKTLGGMDANGVNPVNGNGPSSAFATAIQACFGLVWGPPGTGYSNTSLSITAQSTSTANGGNPCWNYVGSPAGPSGTLAKFNGTIETLDQVAAEGREPNFFELLKAAILSGSLGLGPGKSVFNNGADHASWTVGNYSWGYGYNLPMIDFYGSPSLFSGTFGTAGPPVPATVPDMQVMQIGVNILDQYSSDNYPTAIYFPYLSSAAVPAGSSTWDPVAGNGGVVANAIFGPVTMVYGDKNLPLLNKIASTVCSPNRTGSNTPPDKNDWATTGMEGWLQPELWNPHQQPNTLPANTPVNFEIRAYGSAYTYSSTTGYDMSGSKEAIFTQSPYETYYPGQSSSESPTTVTSFCGPAAGTLAFQLDNTKFPFYGTPRLLVQSDSSGIPGVTVLTSYGLPASTTNPTSFAQSNFPFYGGTVLGTWNPASESWTGTYSAPISNLNAGNFGPYLNHFAAFSTGTITGWFVPGPVPPTPGTPATTPGGDDAGVDFAATSPSNLPGVSFALGWYPAGQTPTASNFHPYSFISGIYTQGPNHLQYTPVFLGCVQEWPGMTDDIHWDVVDPRTSRFGHTFNTNNNSNDNSTLLSCYSTAALCWVCIPSYNSNAPASTPNNFVSPYFNPGYGNPAIGDNFPQDWMANTLTGPPRMGAGDVRNNVTNPANSPAYYADPDGVVRPADGLYLSYSAGDGLMTYTQPGAPTSTTNTNSTSDSSSASNPTTTQHGRRPIILNRPFRSVGELGYTYRDLPFKTLDFFSPSSADAALLDVFTISDETRITNGSLDNLSNGEVNLSNAPAPVLKALLSVGMKKEIDPSYYMSGSSSTTPNKDATNIANAIAAQLSPSTTGGGPLLNRANLATSLGTVIHGAFTANSPDQGNKAYFEAPVRALGDVTNTRTWNLMVDIIAQSGQMSPAAKSTDANALSEFIVEGEKRYWLHIAIDRYTGKIIDQQLEPVYE